MELSNRIVMPAMHLSYTLDGQANDRIVNFYEARAKGGAGLIIVGGCTIDDTGGGPWMIRLDHSRYLAGLNRLTGAVKAHGTKIVAQLYQAGRYAHSAYTGNQSVAPSAVASRLTGEVPHALTPEEIQEVIASFARAAALAKEAGFDGVEIIGSAGYLISQFLSPLTNQREDEYGGSWENRLRFPLAVVKAVIEATGPAYPIIVRVAGNDYMQGSNTGVEAAAFCQALEKLGVAAINVTGGWHETRVPQLTMNVPPGAFTYLARNIKQSVSIPVIACNRLNDPQVGEQILATEQADLIGVARGFIADPAWAAKVAQGQDDEICPCIGCNQGCLDNVFSGQGVTCMTNPRAGREVETELTPAQTAKKFLVVGGGAAGMMAARVLALRGHQVSLWEKEEKLGGQLHLAAIPPGRQDFMRFADYLASQVYSLGVNVILGKQADAEKILREDFQAVIMATGAVERKIPLTDCDGVQVVSAWDVLQGKVIPGRQVVIIGGGPTGVETALYLARAGGMDAQTWHFLNWYQAEEPSQLASLLYQSSRDITLVEMEARLGAGLGASTRWSMLADLKRLGIKTLTGQKAMEISPEGILIGDGTENQWLPVQTVVLAAGSESCNALHLELKDHDIKSYLIGDASSPGDALEAVQEAFDLARTL